MDSADTLGDHYFDQLPAEALGISFGSGICNQRLVQISSQVTRAFGRNLALTVGDTLRSR